MRKATSARLLLVMALLLAIAGLGPAPRANADYTVVVDPNTRYQTFEGWGVSLVWWANQWGGLADARRNAIADAIFHPTSGLGFNIVRYNMGADGPGNVCQSQMRAYGNIQSFQPTAGTYDWTRDATQRWMLQAAKTRGANLFEAFANSAPAWMLNNSCTAGATSPAFDNLSSAHYNNFASYVATIVKRFHDVEGITFRTVDPFNEPDNGYWYSTGRQEGMNVSDSVQNDITKRVYNALVANGAISYTSVAANDDSNIDSAITSFNSYDSTAKGNIAQINSHSYSGSNRSGLYQLAQRYSKRLWMSEWGDSASSPIDAAMRLANRITLDNKQMRPSAWVIWQAANSGDGLDGVNVWGLVNYDSNFNLSYPPRYWAMAQYSRFIRPGSIFIDNNDANTLTAYDPATQKLVLVTVNPSSSSTTVTYNLTRFNTVGSSAAAYRTSSSQSLATLANISIANKSFSSATPAQSITTYVINNVSFTSGPISNGVYKVVGRNSGKLLDVSGASTAQGAQVIQWPWNNGANQQWRFERQSDGTYRITNINSGQALDISGGSTADGGQAIQWPWNGGNNQRWNVTDLGGGYYRITNVNSGKVLAVNGSSTADGATIVQWTSNGSTSQQWQLPRHN
jgi:O-glycosyl hydrolase